MTLPVSRSPLFACWLASGAALRRAARRSRTSACGRARDSTRIVFDLSAAPASYSLFTLDGPARVVIDLEHGSRGRHAAVAVAADRRDPHGQRRSDRASRRARRRGPARAVLDVSAKVAAKSFLTPPNETSTDTASSSTARSSRRRAPPRCASIDGQRDLVVAIDAGHGGKDPGALGPAARARRRHARGRAEARERINAEPGMSAVLMRDGDYFVPFQRALRRRARRRPTCSSRSTPTPSSTARCSGSSVFVLSTAARDAARRRAGLRTRKTRPT